MEVSIIMFHLSWLAHVDDFVLEMHLNGCTISVNFLDSHKNYNTAYKYICKSDKSVLHSNKHPDLQHRFS